MEKITNEKLLVDDISTILQEAREIQKELLQIKKSANNSYKTIKTKCDEIYMDSNEKETLYKKITNNLADIQRIYNEILEKNSYLDEKLQEYKSDITDIKNNTNKAQELLEDIQNKHSEICEGVNDELSIYEEIKSKHEQIVYFFDEVEEKYNQICDDKNNSSSSIASINNINTKVEELLEDIKDKHEKICNDNEDELSLYSQIEDKNNKAKIKLDDIEKIHKKICVDEEDNYSLETKFNQKYDEINSKLEEINEKEEMLDQYYEKIFGKTTDNGEKISGLEDKLSSYNEKIQELLGLATNAMLGSSYKESKESYEAEIKNWDHKFLVTICIMIGVSFLYILDEGLKITNFSNSITQAVIKLPIYIPLIWYGIYSARRRNEVKRLQEEYKHKETMAKAYFGYKQEIKELGLQEDKEVMSKLMGNLVDLVNQNPNDSLNKIQKENIPTIDLIKELPKVPKEAFDFLNKIIGK